MGTTQTRKETEKDDEWISLSEAARQLGETRQTVLTRAVAGDIVAQHIAGRTVVTRASVLRVLTAKTEQNAGKNVANPGKHGGKSHAAR